MPHGPAPFPFDAAAGDPTSMAQQSSYGVGWIVCPAYNEANSLEDFVESLDACVKQSVELARYKLTLLVVDDGSTDATAVRTREISACGGRAFRIEGISLSRNFGQQAALIAGLDTAASNGAHWVCTMDIDGEHPVEILPQLVKHWEEGASLVHTVRRHHKRVSWIKRRFSQSYYRLLQLVSNVRIDPGMADFKLWDGDLLRQVQPFLPQCGLLRLFASWLCPDAPRVEFTQGFADRRSRFSWNQMFSIGFAGLVRYSELPLRLFLLVGVLSFLAGMGVAVFALAAELLGLTVPGWASVLIPISLFGAVQSLSLGVLAEYFVRLMFRRSLPPYVVRASGHHGTRPAEARLVTSMTASSRDRVLRKR